MDLSRLKAINEKKAQEQQQKYELTRQELANIGLQETVVKVVKSLVDFLEGHTSKTIVVNQLKEIGTPDVAQVTSAVESMHDTLKTHENTDLTPLIEVMKGVLDEAKAIPKSHKDIKIPEQKDWSKQFKALTEAVNKATKAIEAQETTVNAPDVNVEAPEVKVDAPDLKPISKELKAVEKAVKAIVIPKVPKTDLSKLEKEQKETTKAVKKVVKTLEEMPAGGGGGGGGGTPDFVVGRDFDYIGVADTSTLVDTLTYKKGGASGDSVRTLTVTFASGAEKISASLTSMDYS